MSYARITILAGEVGVVNIIVLIVKDGMGMRGKEDLHTSTEKTQVEEEKVNEKAKN